jgi:hypothetical protein
MYTFTVFPLHVAKNISHLKTAAAPISLVQIIMPSDLTTCTQRSLRLFIWQQDLRAVVRFVHECFVFRSSLLVVAG